VCIHPRPSRKRYNLMRLLCGGTIECKALCCTCFPHCTLVYIIYDYVYTSYVVSLFFSYVCTTCTTATLRHISPPAFSSETETTRLTRIIISSFSSSSRYIYIITYYRRSRVRLSVWITHSYCPTVPHCRDKKCGELFNIISLLIIKFLKII